MDTQRCIWMDAESVDYQLCPLKQNCDACDFYKEMLTGDRGHQGRSGSALMNLRDPETSLAQFHPGLQYIPGHFWYRRTGASRIRIGIDAFIWQLFSSTHRVLVPGMNTVFAPNQCFSWLLVEGGIIYLKTPFAGRVISINPLFSSGADLTPPLFLNSEPDLWFLELETDGKMTGSSDVLSQSAYLEAISSDLERLQDLTRASHGTDSYSLSRISQLTKHEFAKYLRQISQDRILIC